MVKISKIEAIIPSIKKVRVAAYARVSTNTEEQLLSLETQKEHYENYIKSNPNMEYVGLYYDQGISGTSTNGRDGLQNLIRDCEAGKIDRVITKSISRFTRNTVDCIELVRKLSKLGIYLFFEKENIDTEFMSSELILTIMSSIAESESRSMSDNLKWGIKSRFQSGTYIISTPPYGYKKFDDKMVIVPEEAEIVKEIFNRAINGEGCHVIAKDFNNRNITFRAGKKWWPTTIRNILANIAYTGDIIFQKTYKDNFKKRINYGEKDMYLCKEHHEPIITHEVFQLASSIIEQRSIQNSIEVETRKYLTRYELSGKIICGECGSSFKRRKHGTGNKAYIAWTCKKHLLEKDRCSMKYVRDDELKYSLMKVMRKLNKYHKQILKPFIFELEELKDKDKIHQINAIEDSFNINAEQQQTLLRLINMQQIDVETFYLEKNELLKEESELLKEKNILTKAVNGNLVHVQEAKKLLSYVSKKSNVDTYDSCIVEDFIESIVIESRNEITVKLKCGLHLKERLGTA